MEISPELLGVIVGVVTILKGSTLAINKLISLVSKKEIRPDKREERLAAVEKDLREVQKGIADRDVRMKGLEDSVKELHDCVDRLETKTEKSHDSMNTRLDGIHETVSKLDGKIDIIQVLIQRFINGGRPK